MTGLLYAMNFDYGTGAKRMVHGPESAFDPAIVNDDPLVCIRRRVYIIGTGREAQLASSGLAGCRYETMRIAALDDIEKHIDESACGIVVAMSRAKIKPVIKRLQRIRRLQRVPIHVAAGPELSDKEARQLYASGVRSVVNIAEEALVLKEIIHRTGQVVSKARPVPPSSGQDSFVRSLWIRAKSQVKRMGAMRIWVRDGVVYVTGRLASWSDLKRLRRLFERAPGVEKVIDAGAVIGRRQ